MNNKLISHLACRYVVVTFLFLCSACSRPVDHMAIEVSSLGEGKNRVEVTLGMVMPLAKAPLWGDDATLVGKVVDKSLTTPKSDWAILPVQGVAAHVSIDKVTLHPLPGKKDGQYPSYELSDAVTVHRPPESFGDSPHALLIVLEQGLPIGLLEARHARTNPYTAQELADAAVDYLKKSKLARHS